MTVSNTDSSEANDETNTPYVYDPLAPDFPGATKVVPVESGVSDDESTVGTGTSIALGCVAGTVLLIIVALILLGINSLF